MSLDTPPFNLLQTNTPNFFGHHKVDVACLTGVGAKLRLHGLNIFDLVSIMLNMSTLWLQRIWERYLCNKWGGGNIIVNL